MALSEFEPEGFTLPNNDDLYSIGVPDIPSVPKLGLTSWEIIKECGDIVTTCENCLNRGDDGRCAMPGMYSGVQCSDNSLICDKFERR